MHRGGHDPVKIYNAYKRATEHQGGPTVILAKTVKGYGLGTTESRNASHQEKKLSDEALAESFVNASISRCPRKRRNKDSPYRPPDDSPEMVYLQERRKALGGYLPKREVPKIDFAVPGA